MIEAPRLEDWPERLIRTVSAHRAAPFAWGEFDCATFFAAAVEAVIGIDPLTAYRPWASERDAARVLLDHGYRDMAHFTECLFPEIAPAKARRGDIGFCAERKVLTCPAVILGAEAAQRDERSWLMFPASTIIRAFRVG